MERDPLRRFVADGDADAFCELVHQYQNLVYGICARILGRTPEADDATQETFLKLAKRAGEIHTNPASWLHSCARTTALNVRRAHLPRQKRERSLNATGADIAGVVKVEEACEDEERSAIVDDCLDELSEIDREVVVSYFFVERTQEQIAERIGVSQTTINRHLDQALEALRRKFRLRGLVAPVALSAFFADLSAQTPVPASLARKLASLSPTTSLASSTALVAAAAPNFGWLSTLALPFLMAAAAVGYWKSGSAEASANSSARPETIAVWHPMEGPMPAELIHSAFSWENSGDALAPGFINASEAGPTAHAVLWWLKDGVESRPIVIDSTWLSSIKMGGCGLAYWVEDGRIKPAQTWLSADAGPASRMRTYLFGRYAVSIDENQSVRGLVVFDRDYPARNFGFLINGIAMTELSIRYVAEEDIPVFIADPQRLIQELHLVEAPRFRPVTK